MAFRGFTVNRWVAVLVVCGLAMSSLGAAKSAQKVESDTDRYIRELTVPVRLVVLGTSKDFAGLKAEAERISRKTGVAFSMQGLAYSKEKGLYYKDDPERIDFFYMARRNSEDYDTGKPFISIEESGAYPGMKPGYYVIVGDLCWTRKDAAKSLERFRKTVPKAYTQKTTVYMGCRS